MTSEELLKEIVKKIYADKHYTRGHIADIRAFAKLYHKEQLRNKIKL